MVKALLSSFFWSQCVRETWYCQKAYGTAHSFVANDNGPVVPQWLQSNAFQILVAIVLGVILTKLVQLLFPNEPQRSDGGDFPILRRDIDKWKAKEKALEAEIKSLKGMLKGYAMKVSEYEAELKELRSQHGVDSSFEVLGSE